MKIKIIAILLGLTYSISSMSQIFDSNVFKFAKAYSIINSYYVDTVDNPKLIETAISKILEQLDPHSIYISADELHKMRDPLNGSFDGIGIQFNILRDTLLVVSTIPGGPSQKVGLMAGDKIIEVDGENIAGVGLKNSKVFKILKGKKGTKVKVTIKRNGHSKLIHFTITRGKIPVNSLDAAYMVNKNTIYVKLNKFGAKTMIEYRKALSKFESQHPKNIILDLTDNGGGYLNTAINIADQFLKNDKMIVYTEGKHSPRENYRATSNGMFEDGKVVVMINEGSASASEIVSGAVQDWDRGVLVGRRSFGKGLVQKPFGLPDGSVIRLTVAHYHTPTGRVIQRPYNKGIKDYYRDIIKRYEDGELMHADSIHFPDSLKFKTLNNKRTVYGGGGIMPDIFVPIDTSEYSDYYRDLNRKGILNHFVLIQVNKNRKALKAEYKTFKEFNNKFVVSQDILNKLTKYASNSKLKLNEAELLKSLKLLKVQIKALYARSLFTYEEFYQIINNINPIFKKAVEVISNDSEYNSKLISNKK